MNGEAVILDSLALFHRLILVADRETTVPQSLSFELTQLPMSLFDKHQFMRKPNKSELGTYLKSFTTVTITKTKVLIMDGGWLLHQLNAFKSGITYGEICLQYMSMIPKDQSVTVVFDGYMPSIKNHDHRRRRKKILHRY